MNWSPTFAVQWKVRICHCPMAYVHNVSSFLFKSSAVKWSKRALMRELLNIPAVATARKVRGGVISVLGGMGLYWSRHLPGSWTENYWLADYTRNSDLVQISHHSWNDRYFGETGTRWITYFKIWIYWGQVRIDFVQFSKS